MILHIRSVLKDLRVTGVDSAPEGVTALGWVSEEEK